ncbi:MAG TPA: hypothetical protein VMJ10_09250 [Kofleriaceae bacterium]|nr:hypothetical protein [Kofleriaceae bacterium]
MQGVIRTALVASVLAACGSSPHATPDASAMGSDDSGSGSGTGGFFVHWWSDPKLPGAVGNNATVTSADFWLTSLRVIGDADPGDDRTTTDPGHIYWDDTGGPPYDQFKDAPSGLYSKLAVALDGLVINSSYDIKGSVDLGGSAGTKSFHIHDLAPMNISLDIANTLQPGGTVDVTIHVDFTAAIGVVDFATLDTDDDDLDLDTLDSQMPAFRTALQNSFSIAGGTTSTPPQP